MGVSSHLERKVLEMLDVLSPTHVGIILLVLAHYVGDYSLQTDWMAENKGKSWYVALAHSCVWSFAIACTGMLIGMRMNPLVIILVLVIPHMMLDHVKAAGDLWAGHVDQGTALAIDQVAHFVQLLVFSILSA